MLLADNAAQIPLIEKLIALATSCRLFDSREKDKVYSIRTRNAELLGPSQLASMLLAWSNFRKRTFGSAFVPPIEPMMNAVLRLREVPDKAQKPFWSLFKDWDSLKPTEQDKVSPQMLPFFDFPPGEFGVKFTQYLKNPKQEINGVLPLEKRDASPVLEKTVFDEAYFCAWLRKASANACLKTLKNASLRLKNTSKENRYHLLKAKSASSCSIVLSAIASSLPLNSFNASRNNYITSHL